MNIYPVQTKFWACKVDLGGERRYNECMSRKAIKKSLNRSFRKSAEYSAALVFGVLFLVSSMYGLPNFSATKAVNASDSKNLKTASTVKLDSSYKKYCDSDDHSGLCKYIPIRGDALIDIPVTEIDYQVLDNQIYNTQITYNLSIRAPPVLV